jgi:DNA-binding ferritin-like protein
MTADSSALTPGLPAKTVPPSRKASPVPFAFIAFAVSLSVCGIVVVACVTWGLARHSSALPGVIRGTLVGCEVMGVCTLTASGLIFRQVCGQFQERRRQLTELKADTLPERARQAAQALQQAMRLAAELQAEMDTRTALLEQARQQTEDLQRLAEADPRLLRVTDERWDRAVARRFSEFERGARQREWTIGTVVAVAAGIVAILLSHYLLGF